MTTPVIAFFNNKGGVGKTSLVYHLAWMYTEQQLRVVAADLDPQANLTAAFLDEDRLATLFEAQEPANTVFDCVRPLLRGVGDVAAPRLKEIAPRLALVVGDMGLSTFEDALSEVWPKCNDRDERAFRITSAFWRMLQLAGRAHQADVILMDLGPNLGAINRAALIGADHVVLPLGPDLFSLQGLRNLGPALRRWRSEWLERRSKNPDSTLVLPLGAMNPLGYVVLRHTLRVNRPMKAFDRWIARMPAEYREAILDQHADADQATDQDPNCIARLKDYRSLMPLAQEARKPMFLLTPADGAIGAHANAVKSAYHDFLGVAREIARRAGTPAPQTPG